jgi:hypothetical protein
MAISKPTVAGSAISSARTFAAKANSVTCPDEATRQRLEREGQAIVGELQQLTQASIDHEQSSLTPQLISASTTVTDALNGLGRNCSPPKGAGGPIKYDTGYFLGTRRTPTRLQVFIPHSWDWVAVCIPMSVLL